MKRNIVFNIKHQTAESFRNHVWNNYKKYRLCRIFSYSSYFSKVIDTLYEEKKRLFNSSWIEDLNDQQLKFLRKTKSKSPISNSYHNYNDSITIRLENELIEKLYVLTYNCYINEFKHLENFSISVFFEVIFDSIKKIHYTKNELEKL